MMKSVPRVLHRLIILWSNNEFCQAILVHIPSGWRSTSFNLLPNFECRANFCHFFEHFKKKKKEPPATTQVAKCRLAMSEINRAHGVCQSPFRYFCQRLVIFRPSQSYYDGNRDCVMRPLGHGHTIKLCSMNFASIEQRLVKALMLVPKR